MTPARDRPSPADGTATTDPDGNPRGPIESEEERWRRNFAELLQELRVAQTGVQILFAFLLTLAFSSRFIELGWYEKSVYFVALLSAAAAAALIIAPVAYHRVLFRRGRKPQIVRAAHRAASGGLAFLLIAMCSAVLLVSDIVLPRIAAIVVTAVTGFWFVLWWGIMPWLRRNEGDDDADE